jgi:hypothetical protein
MSACAAGAATTRSFRITVSLVFLLAAAGLLLANLGHYSLWSDEADTALFARGIWETGDTSAVFGENVYAYRNGMLLSEFRNRYTPPLAYYLVAPMWGLFGDEPFWLRLPFALCGLASIGLIVCWLWQDEATRATWLLTSLGFLGSVSFFLFARQCRYYALATLASLVIAYLYLHYRGHRSALVLMMLASLALLGTQYMNFAALYAALAVDYGLWQRKTQKLPWREWLLLLAPQLILGAILLWIWCPVGKGEAAAGLEYRLWQDKLLLAWLNVRDVNACQFVIGLLLLIAPCVGWKLGDAWLVRLPVAIVVYLLAITACSPQSVIGNPWADVRYLAPIIPAGIFLAVRFIEVATRHFRCLAVPLAILAFGTNILNLPWSPQAWRCTPWLFAQELAANRTTATAQAAAWINHNVREGQTIAVVPGFQSYPLMVHAPRAVYAWQLDDSAPKQFSHLPAIHFMWRSSPDYFIVFGPRAEAILKDVLPRLAAQGTRYRREAVLDVYFDDGIRPELLAHRFKPITKFDKTTDAVFIYRRISTSSQVPAP